MSGGAAIFFARDFLATEFARLSAAFADRARVYIVLNQREADTVRQLDPAGEIELVPPAAQHPLPDDDASAIGRDRTLRFAAIGEIDQVRSAIAQVCSRILARHPAPAFYFDEPVSGYANEMFNRRFGAAGALCLQFQTTWVPGYLFLVSDAGQESPVPLGLIGERGRELVQQHVAGRASGGALPHYVLNYGKKGRRARDLALTKAKQLYRRVARSGANYVDRDTEAHRFHAEALRHSLTARYSPDPVTDADRVQGTLVFPLHYEPESLLSYFSPYYRQEEIAAQLLDSLPGNWRLVVKEHPSQPGALHMAKWRDVRRARRVTILPGNYPGSRLLAIKPTVVSLGSTFALEAALAGCPTGVLGTVHFRDAPGITRLERPGDWQELAHSPIASRDAISDWYAGFMNRHAFAGNLMRGKTWIEEPAQLAAALQHARDMRR